MIINIDFRTILNGLNSASKSRMSRTWDYDCAVIGGGPGGLVSSLYLKRFKRKVILINQGVPRASWIPKTHNLIGFDQGISGRNLLRRLHRHVDQVGVDKISCLGEVKRYRDGFQVLLDEKQKLTAKKVILATGIDDVHPTLENVFELRALGLLRYCSICDAYEYQGCPVIALAKDDSGVQKALFIRQWTKDICLVIPKDLNLAPQRIRQLRSVRAKVVRTDVFELEPSRKPPGVWLHVPGKRPIYGRVAYVELGCQVKDTAFGSIKNLRKSKDGFLIATSEQRLSVPGLFAVGDCVNLLGQISVAAGQAAVAATTIHNDLLDF